MHEVRCCCNADNLIGTVPEEAGLAAGLQLRELEEGGVAFDSNHNEEAVRNIPGFQEATSSASKTWKKTGTKTWKKK